VRFRNSTLTPLEISVRFLRADLAVLHWSWRIEGDRNFDQTLRKPRLRLFTMIVAMTDDKWLVTVAQNTNRIPPPDPDPEMEGIKPGIPFPKGQQSGAPAWLARAHVLRPAVPNRRLRPTPSC
jgi:hypothetical protein